MGKRNRERRRVKQRRRESARPVVHRRRAGPSDDWPRAGRPPRPDGFDSLGDDQREQFRPPRQDPSKDPSRDPRPDRVATEMGLLRAAVALGDGDRAGADRRLVALGIGPGADPSRAAATAQVLEVLLDRVIESAWQGGWQPADLERLVRRRHGARHVCTVADAIAHQHLRYAPATVTRSWRAQLRAIGADPWDAPPAAPAGALPFDAPAAGTGDGTNIAALRRRVEVLSVLLTVPQLPRLGPLPGEARAGADAASAGQGREVDGRVLERVRALLAKAESTTFVEEAEAFTAKAQELMARHALDRAMLEGDTGSAGGPGGRRIATDDPYAQSKSLLLDKVATANRCRSVWSGSLGFSTVFGHEGDLDGVELLYTSLLVQATRVVAGAGPQVDRWGRSSTRSFRKSFYVAYAIRIGERLRESAAAAEAAGTEAHGAALLPVLAARDEAVDEATDRAYPTTEMYSVGASNGAGWIAGTTAADQAQLNASPEVESRRASA